MLGFIWLADYLLKRLLLSHLGRCAIRSTEAQPLSYSYRTTCNRYSHRFGHVSLYLHCIPMPFYLIQQRKLMCTPRKTRL